MFLKSDQYRVWCSIFYFKLVNCILLRPMFVFVKGRGTCGSGERNVKIWINFRKSPRFSLTSPSSQEREKSSHPDFTMCGEPWGALQCKHETIVRNVIQNDDIWATKEMKTQIKRALVFTKKTSTLVTKGRALLQIEKKGRASLEQGRVLRPVKTG